MTTAFLMNPGGTVAADVTPGGALKVDGSGVTQPVSGPLTDAQIRATPLPVSGSLALSGSVSVSNFPATQPVSGTVAVSNLPATQPVSGSVSVSNLPATQPVSGTFWQTTQPVSGTFWQTTQPVSGTVTATGPLTDAQLRATAVPVSGTVTATGPLTDTQLRATAVPVSLTSTTVTGSVAVTGPLTDTQLRASAVPVSGTFFQATQPISGTVTATGPLTDTQLRASAVPVSGPLTDTQLRASAIPVSGTFFQGTQPVSLAALPALASMGAASSTPTGVVSLGNSLGKTNVMKTGSLASSATTADQVILTYTVTTGKTLYLEYFEFSGRLTTFATTATLLGTISLETPSGTKVYTTDLVTAGNQNNVMLSFPEPIAIAAGVVVRVVCTPSAATAFTWKANFGGYEK